jgi:hypothetical protein
MIKLRTKASRAIGAIAAATVTIGLAVGIPIVTAAPAAAFSCVYVGGIHNVAHYLDDYGGGSRTYVHTYPHTGSANQTWCLEAASQGGYYIHPGNNVTGLCLDAHTANRFQPIWVYTCNGTVPQRWCWDRFGYIYPRASASVALYDNGLYQIVTIDIGANRWGTDNGFVPRNNC